MAHNKGLWTLQCCEPLCTSIFKTKQGSMLMFSVDSPQHPVRSIWAASRLEAPFPPFQPYSEVWCSFLGSSCKTRQVHLLSALTGWEEGTQEILSWIINESATALTDYYSQYSNQVAPGLLVLQWSARNLWDFVNSGASLGAGGAREAVNKNKGARLNRSRAALFAGALCAVVAWVRVRGFGMLQSRTASYLCLKHFFTWSSAV